MKYKFLKYTRHFGKPMPRYVGKGDKGSERKTKAEKYEID